MFSPNGITSFVGGTESLPRQLESMSQDLGPNGAGYYQNFAYGVVALESAYLQLVDFSSNAAGGATEALYLDTLSVPAGSTLDLNGIHVYARVVQGGGTILGDTLTLVSAGITVTPLTGLTTTEVGGSTSFTICLNARPEADVTIALESSDTTEGTVSPLVVTFTSANWMVPQTASITGVDDAFDDGNVTYTIMTAAATSADPGYSGLDAADVTVVNIDDDSNDTQSLVVSSTNVSVTEGATNTFTVRLTFQPAANVTVNVARCRVTQICQSAVANP